MIEEWIPSRIILVDQSVRLVNAWRTAFSRYDNITIQPGDYFEIEANAIVSPANSFGIMDGGIDLAIRDKLGFGIERRVQEVILTRYHGEMPVGIAEVIETKHQRYPYLICAPTMRIPEQVSASINAYLAFRAALLACGRFNHSSGTRKIDSLLCCGLATGVGGMDPSRCAAQMSLAYKSMIFPPVIGRFESIHEFHRDLRST